MESIATLIQHDPYFDVPLGERVAARRERHARLFDRTPRKEPAPVLDKPKPIVLRARDPIADAKAHREMGGSPLDPRLTFGSFAIGRSNTLAHAAARQIADSRGGEPVMFNPLYIHAGVGLGKTHLLQAIALAGNSDDRKVLYLTAEKFVYSFISAIKQQTALEFKQALRGIDVIVIDDLQYMQGKSAQAEFCHTLNAALDAGRQVVLGADRLPSDLDSMDERIRSRLAAGLVVEIGKPNEEQRLDILQSRIGAVRVFHPGFDIPEPVREFIARAVVNSGRDIEASVNRLLAQSTLNGSVITLEMAEREVRDLMIPQEPKRIKIEDIQRIVARHYGVSRQDLISARRTADIVRPRQIAVYLCRHLTLRSLPEIGRRFGGRDHTTQLHAIRKIAALVERDAVLAAEVARLMEVIKDATNS